MIPCKRLDIGWGDLAFGLVQCLVKDERRAIYAACQQRTPAPDQAQFFLSVRSGFDLYLRVAQFAPGSQVLVPAITIPDMLQILKAHALVPVPVDLDPESLWPDLDSLEKGRTEKTVGLLVTHLFGARMPMEALVDFVCRHGLVLMEDCAQAYWGDGFTGHPASQVRMFSFGPIKHNTALGGSLFFVGDPVLRKKMHALHGGYPVQSRRQYFRRLVKYGLVSLFNRPWPYTALCALCRLVGLSHDSMTYRLTRGFIGGELLEKIRQQPCRALLALLARRLGSDALARTQRRRQVAAAFRSSIPDHCCPGHGGDHSHWLFAVRVDRAEALCQRLWQAGFDAHLWPPSLCLVPPVEDLREQVPVKALVLERQLLFLPVYGEVGPCRLEQLGRIVRQYAARACDTALPHVRL